MDKIIINIKSDITHDHAIDLVKQVIDYWYISWTDKYCRVTQWEDIGVWCKKTKTWHSFTTYNPKWKQ